MVTEDFEQIRNYTPEDILRTNATLESVHCATIHALDMFCFMTGIHWHLLENGLTTGKHISIYHPRGDAADVYPAIMDNINIRQCADWALIAGFRGRGIYWNGRWYSMHLDRRPIPGSWIRWRHENACDGWHEMAMLSDPREVERAHK